MFRRSGPKDSDLLFIALCLTCCPRSVSRVDINKIEERGQSDLYKVSNSLKQTKKKVRLHSLALAYRRQCVSQLILRRDAYEGALYTRGLSQSTKDSAKSSVMFFSPSRSRQEDLPRQPRCQLARARRQRRPSSCPRAVARQGHAPYTRAAPATRELPPQRYHHDRSMREERRAC